MQTTQPASGDYGTGRGSYPDSIIISTENLSRAFGWGDGSVTAVNDVSLAVSTGEFLSLVGRSGSGKTTLLNLMAGLDQPTVGKVWFHGKHLGSFSESEMVQLRRRNIGFIFQSFGLIPLLSAHENVELPLHISGVPWRERRRRAAEVLALVGLSGRANHRPYELSGGEQQRVAIARALASNPEVLFADEPTGELDTATGMSIANILRDVVRNQGVTVIVATHDLTLSSMSDRVLQMVDGAVLQP